MLGSQEIGQGVAGGTIGGTVVLPSIGSMSEDTADFSMTVIRSFNPEPSATAA